MPEFAKCCKFTSTILLIPPANPGMSLLTIKNITAVFNANFHLMSKVTCVPIFTITILVSSTNFEFHFSEIFLFGDISNFDVDSLKFGTELKTDNSDEGTLANWYRKVP